MERGACSRESLTRENSRFTIHDCDRSEKAKPTRWKEKKNKTKPEQEPEAAADFEAVFPSSPSSHTNSKLNAPSATMVVQHRCAIGYIH